MFPCRADLPDTPAIWTPRNHSLSERGAGAGVPERARQHAVRVLGVLLRGASELIVVSWRYSPFASCRLEAGSSSPRIGTHRASRGTPLSRG